MDARTATKRAASLVDDMEVKRARMYEEDSLDRAYLYLLKAEREMLKDGGDEIVAIQRSIRLVEKRLSHFQRTACIELRTDPSICSPTPTWDTAFTPIRPDDERPETPMAEARAESPAYRPTSPRLSPTSPRHSPTDRPEYSPFGD